MHSGLERLENPRWERWVIALLIVAAVAPFAQTFGFGYVLDDTFVIRSNPDLQGWGSLIEVWKHTYGGNDAPFDGLYRPLTMTLFALVWNAGGQWPLWFHLVAVAMHALVTVLVFRVLERGVGWVPAALATLWFAVHPLHVEAVANIANSSEVLVAIFTCALTLHVARIAEQNGAISRRQAVVAGALYLAAFLSKESGAMAPILATLGAWGWHLARPRAAESAKPLNRWAPVLAAWAVGAMLVLLLRAAVLGGPVTGDSIAATGLDELTSPQRVWAMLSLGPTVLRLLVWPPTVNPHYGPTTFPQSAADLWAGTTVAILFTVALLAVRLAKSGERRPLVAVAWIAVAFLPASNLLVATGQILAERTLYVPSIGVAMLVGLALRQAPQVGRLKHPWLVAWPAIVGGVAFVAAVFAARTALWTGAWRSHETLFAQMIAADTAGYVGYWFSGVHAGRNGRMDQALALLERAYARYPRDRGLKLDLSDALLQQGQPRRAAAIAGELMGHAKFRSRPHAVAVYLDAVGRSYGADSVIAAGRRLMEQAPSPTAALFLGQAHVVRGDTTAAARVYREALRSFPRDTALRARLTALGESR